MTTTMLIPLLKVDAAQRLVYGQIDETPDRAGEVFDYASSKPLIEGWSADLHKASGGKSFGNVRAMHGKVAAGLLKSIHFDDAAKRVEICAHIVDDAEWQKVQQGVYTGFSPGGSYAKRWKDGPYTRYTAQPSEISIVDLPCIPSASFTMIKADGVVEQVMFKADHTQADQDRLQAIHDHSVGMGATCDGAADKSAATGDLAKLHAAHADALTKLAGEHRLALTKLTGERDALQKRVAELEKQPIPGGPHLKTFDKTVDSQTSGQPTAGDPGAGSFDERLTAINKMAAGPDKAKALRKLGADFADTDTDTDSRS